MANSDQREKSGLREIHGRHGQTGQSKPSGRRAFSWSIYLASICFGSAAVVGSGLAIDLVLAGNGIAIHVGFEAMLSAFFGLVFMTPGVLIVWRLGLVTLGQYLLGVVILFLPITLLTLLVYPIFDVWIVPPKGSTAETILFSSFVRLLRAAALAPIAILAFWLAYHVLFRADPRKTP